MILPTGCKLLAASTTTQHTPRCAELCRKAELGPGTVPPLRQASASAPPAVQPPPRCRARLGLPFGMPTATSPNPLPLRCIRRRLHHMGSSFGSATLIVNCWCSATEALWSADSCNCNPRERNHSTTCNCPSVRASSAAQALSSAECCKPCERNHSTTCTCPAVRAISISWTRSVAGLLQARLIASKSLFSAAAQ